MLEKPNLKDRYLMTHLQGAYNLNIVKVAFLPLGADPNTAVYRAATLDGTPFFVKLRRGVFAEASVTLPRYLKEQGVGHLIAPLYSKLEQPSTTLGAFTVTVYPFIAGRSGYAVALSEENWRDLGATLKRLHTLDVPPSLLHTVRRETFDASGRETLRRVLSHLEHFTSKDDTSSEMAAFLWAKRTQILELIDHAERFAQRLQARPLQMVLCHGDLHAGNFLVDDHAFYIVDWDDPILAPKERDLMFFGGGQGFIGRTPQEEEQLFYEGYAPVRVDPVALAYYRFERIVQDLAIYGDELVQQLGSEAERQQALGYVTANFAPGGTIERAYMVNTTLADG